MADYENEPLFPVLWTGKSYDKHNFHNKKKQLKYTVKAAKANFYFNTESLIIIDNKSAHNRGLLLFQPF